MTDHFINIDERFTFLSLLGSGSYGSVHHVQNKTDGKKHAIKMHKLNQASIVDPGVLREICALTRFDHPHIVKPQEVFYGHMNDSWYVCILMEAYTMNLLDYVSNTKDPFPPPIIELTFLKLLDALNYVAMAGWGHCDLSVANIMMDEGGAPVIIDFGLSKKVYRQFDKELPPNRSVRPIELFNGDHVDVRVFDSWALGCILYFLLEKKLVSVSTSTASTSTYASTSSENTEYHLALDKTVMAQLKQQFAPEYRIIKKLLQYNPKKRPTVQQLTHLPEVQEMCKKYNYEFKKFTQQPADPQDSGQPAATLLLQNSNTLQQLLMIMNDNNVYNEVIHLTVLNFVAYSTKYSDAKDVDASLILFTLFWISNNIISPTGFDIQSLTVGYNMYNNANITKSTFTDLFIVLCYKMNWNFDPSTQYHILDKIPQKFRDLYTLITFAQLLTANGGIDENETSVPCMMVMKLTSSRKMKCHIKNLLHTKIVTETQIVESYNNFVKTVHDVQVGVDDTVKSLLNHYASLSGDDDLLKNFATVSSSADGDLLFKKITGELLH